MAMKICNHCGKPNKETAKFCLYCGKKIEIPAAGRFCSECGAQLKEGSKFCLYCGHKAEIQPAPVQQTPAQPAQVQQTPARPAPVQQAPVPKVQPQPNAQTPVYTPQEFNTQKKPAAPAKEVKTESQGASKTKKTVLAVVAAVCLAALVIVIALISPEKPVSSENDKSMIQGYWIGGEKYYEGEGTGPDINDVYPELAAWPEELVFAENVEVEHGAYSVELWEPHGDDGYGKTQLEVGRITVEGLPGDFMYQIVQYNEGSGDRAGRYYLHIFPGDFDTTDTRFFCSYIMPYENDENYEVASTTEETTPQGETVVHEYNKNGVMIGEIYTETDGTVHVHKFDLDGPYYLETSAWPDGSYNEHIFYKNGNIMIERSTEASGAFHEFYFDKNGNVVEENHR